MVAKVLTEEADLIGPLHVGETSGVGRQEIGSFRRYVDAPSCPLLHRLASIGRGELHVIRQQKHFHLPGPRSSNARFLVEQCLLQLIGCQNLHPVNVQPGCDKKFCRPFR